MCGRGMKDAAQDTARFRPIFYPKDKRSLSFFSAWVLVEWLIDELVDGLPVSSGVFSEVDMELPYTVLFRTLLFL